MCPSIHECVYEHTGTLVTLLSRWSILLHYLDLRRGVQGQKHKIIFAAQLLVNHHQTVVWCWLVLLMLTARNDDTHGTKRGHAPFNMARREVQRRLNVVMAFLYMQNTEALLMLRFC